MHTPPRSTWQYPGAVTLRDLDRLLPADAANRPGDSDIEHGARATPGVLAAAPSLSV